MYSVVSDRFGLPDYCGRGRPIQSDRWNMRNFEAFFAFRVNVTYKLSSQPDSEAAWQEMTTDPTANQTGVGCG